MPVPVDADQRRVLQVTWDLFDAHGAWPTFAQVDRKLDRDFDLDTRAVGDTLPDDLLYPRLHRTLQSSQQLQLTIAGVAACEGSQEYRRYFLEVIRYAAQVEKSWSGPPLDETDDPILTASDFVQHATLPAAGRDAFLTRLGLLLNVEKWGWHTGSYGGPDWQFTISRDIRALRDVMDLDQYWAIRMRDRAPATFPEPSAGGVTMAAGDKLFISHASADKRLAELFIDSLRLGDVPGDRMFYSSARGTGIPSGEDVRGRLRAELQKAGLVVELISSTFLLRPMCLIELGGAWALEKPTYPVVVPPLQRHDATRQIGDVQMGVLGDDADIDDVFEELHDRLASDLGLHTKATSWNPAVRHFKEHLPPVLAAIQLAATPSSPTARPTPTGPTGRFTGSKITIENYAVVDNGYGGEVQGEATNIDSVEHTATLKATFYDAADKILGTADGLVSQLAAGETKTFNLTSLNGIPQHARLKVQVDAVI